MRLVNVDELRTMVGRSEPCMSVYAPLSGDYEQDVVSLQQILDEGCWRAREAFPMIANHFESISASKMLKTMPEGASWQGVAVFKSVMEGRLHPMEHHTEALVVVSDSFHLRPLLSKLQMNIGYMAIRLERDRVQVYRGAYDGVTMTRQFLTPRRVRASADAPPTHAAQKSESRFTPAARRIVQMQMDRVTLRFYRDTDKEIRRSLIHENMPVILVGEERLIRLFKTANRHRVPIMATIHAAGGSLPLVGEMHLKAIELLDDIHRRQALRGVIEYRYTKPVGRAIDDLGRIAQAAAQGQIKSLLLRAGTRIWGRVSRKGGNVYIDTMGSTALSDDILDDISEMVLKHKGQVFSLNPNEMPTAEPAAAVLVSRAAV